MEAKHLDKSRMSTTKHEKKIFLAMDNYFNRCGMPAFKLDPTNAAKRNVDLPRVLFLPLESPSFSFSVKGVMNYNKFLYRHETTINTL